MRHQLRLTTSPAHPALGIDDDVVPLDQAGPHQRRQREDRGGGVAAGIGDERRSADVLPEQLRQTVDRVPEPGGIRMLVAIPLEVGGSVVEPVIGREVDHLRAGGEDAGKDLGAGAVGEASEDTVGPLADLLWGEILERQIEPADEARMDARYRRTSILTAGDGNDLHLRVAEENLEQFQSGVAGGTEDGDFDHRGSSRGIDPAVL
jgi:hypothetical protein